MNKIADRVAAAAMLVLHAGLLGWAVAGGAELLGGPMPWPRLSNPLFSPAMLAVHWAAIATAASVFLLGWWCRWHVLPWAMVACYAFMASVCAVQTLFVLRHDSRFLDMALEYAAYLAILAWLFASPLVAARLARRPAAMTRPDSSD